MSNSDCFRLRCIISQKRKYCHFEVTNSGAVSEEYLVKLTFPYRCSNMQHLALSCGWHETKIITQYTYDLYRRLVAETHLALISVWHNRLPIPVNLGVECRNTNCNTSAGYGISLMARLSDQHLLVILIQHFHVGSKSNRCRSDGLCYLDCWEQRRIIEIQILQQTNNTTCSILVYYPIWQSQLTIFFSPF